MKIDFDGFIIYNKTKNNKHKVFGVVSDDYECRALSSKIPDKFKQYIVPIEDKRFYNHKGIDLRGITRAFFRNFTNMKIVEGGSTISQQLARNLLKDNSKTIKRKIKESIKAIEIEHNYSKDDILNLYFNSVYFGKNLRGVRVASLYYFDKEPSKLSNLEILFLITILRGPNYYINNLEDVNKRILTLSNILLKNNQINLNQYMKIHKKGLNIKNNKISVVRNNAIPFITERIDTHQKSIISTLNPAFQKLAEDFVKGSSYPVSIIIINKQKVTGFSSYYGSNYPFIFKSNVGSTLKPFIYYLAKKKGINPSEKFNAYKNSLNLNIKEVSWVESKINIEEALFYSNNNSFINISDKIGMEETLKFLSKTLNISRDEVFPSTILGATKKGLSLYQLTLIYNKFLTKDIDENKIKLMKALNNIFKAKFNLNIENAFLKTGTTNNNEERLAIIHHANTTYGFLRNGNLQNESSKNESFLNQIKKKFSFLFEDSKEYKWI